MDIKMKYNPLKFTLLFLFSLLLMFPPLSFAQIDTQTLAEVSGDVDVNTSRMRFDRINNTNFLTASLINLSGEPVSGPVYVVIDSISSPVVEVGNADHVTQDGKPVFIYDDQIAGGILASGQTSETKTWLFLNPQRQRFTYTYSIWIESGPVNTTPVAEAGPDQTALVTQTVTLDGSGSSDGDGDPLTFSWTLTPPVGSSAVLSDTGIMNPEFTVDIPGDYLAELVVNDGIEDSTPDTVLISTLNSAPVADAGPDQSALYGDTVTLDGTASSDIDGDSLTYNWSLTTVPGGSNANLSDPTVSRPTFTIDVSGDYTASLIVNDGSLDSPADTVQISTNNTPPVADAGADQSGLVNDTITLDGTASYDVDGDPLTFAWSLTTVPEESGATLSDSADSQPNFEIDVPGTYVAQLIVNDGTIESPADTVSISTENTAPVANAGPDQTGLHGQTVVLDGSGSSDADGDDLEYTWVLISKPDGSTEDLSDPSSVNPNLTIDVSGDYVAQLTVNDGTIDSAPDSVTITTDNSAPVADAGPGQTGQVGDTITLDGSDSYDVDGDTLTLEWSLTVPEGSLAVLSGNTIVHPTFVIDVQGSYIAQLIVNDGFTNSSPDSVTINTENTAPVANAGPDQSVYVTEPVTLDGGDSTDVDGDLLTYFWNFTSRPQGSTATLSDPASVTPSFTADLFGTYVISLVVNDGTVNSDPDQVSINTLNTAPVADAGPDQTIHAGQDVQLNGSGSHDVDNDLLNFAWSISSAPTGSAAAISDTTLESPALTTDLIGNYVIQLIVNDGVENSAPDTVEINTSNSTPVAVAGSDQDVVLGDTVQLYGQGSSDADSDPLSYSWSLINLPGGSAADFTDSTVANPEFIPDMEGTYIAQLIVNDGFVDSLPSTVTITVAPAAPASITLIPSVSDMPTRSTLTITAELDNPAPTTGLEISLGTSNALVSVPASVMVDAGNTSVNFDVESGVDTGDVDLTASAIDLSPDTATITVVLRDLSLSSPLVGINRTVTASINLPMPAPSGGAQILLSVADTSVATVSPALVTIAQGSTSATFELTGGPGPGVGFTTVTANGTAAGYVSKDLEITVTDRLIDLPQAQDLALGEIREIPILIAPDAAPAEGVEVSITSNNTSLVEVLTPTVMVPAGSFQATARIRAATDAKGEAVLTASNDGFAPDTCLVAVTASLNIIQTSVSLDESGPGTIFMELYSGGERFPAPAGGVEITMVSGNSDCVSVTSPVTMAEGDLFGAAVANYGGESSLPCTTTVTATHPVFGTDTVDVTVQEVEDIGTFTITDRNSYNDLRVGSSLQESWRLSLSNGDHGGITAHITSSDPSKVLVSPSASTPGTPVIEVFIADGATYVDFYVQGVAGVTGSATITATEASFTPATASVEVVESVFVISSHLPSETTSLSANSPFYVYSYYLHTNGTTRITGYASATGGPQQVTMTSSSPSVGQVVTYGDTESPVTIEIAVNGYYSAWGASSGGVEFNPLAAGTTTVSATAPGFDSSYSGASKSVEVVSPGMTIDDRHSYSDERVGSDFQEDWRLTLEGSNHGGVTVRISSDDASIALVSPNASTPGSSSIDIDIPDGQGYVDFYVQGVSQATGSTTIHAVDQSSPEKFAPTSIGVEVVEPVFYMSNLPSETTSLSANSPFYVYSYYIHTNGSTRVAGYASATGGPLQVTMTSSDASVGQVVTDGDTESPVTIEIPVNGRNSAWQASNGGVEFNPLAAGTTTVSATAPGFNSSYSAASQTVEVTAPGMTINDQNSYSDERVGSDLQERWRLTLEGSNHGGVTVRISSDNDGIALVSPNATTSGSSSIDIDIPDGQGYVDFYVQGVSQATGSTTIHAVDQSSPEKFAPTSIGVEVVEPVFYMSNLPSETTSLSANSPFYVYSYYIHTNGSTRVAGYASATGGPLQVTMTSSDASVGQVVTDGDTESPVTIEIPVNGRNSAWQASNGGVEFNPLAAGTTTVSATAPGFNSSYSAASQTVEVTAPGMTINDQNSYSDERVGSDLQERWRLTLEGSDHGGVTVRISSDNDGIALVSPNATTSGSSSIDIDIPDGQSYVDFYVQGVSQATGSTTIHAVDQSSPEKFARTSIGVEVVEPVFYMSNLPSETTSLSANSPFYVYSYYIHTNGSTQVAGYASATGGPLQVTMTSSDASVGQVVTDGDTESPVTIEIPVNGRYSAWQASNGGVEFNPLAAGTTTVSATAPGFNSSYSAASQTVEVTAPGMTITDRNSYGDLRIGGGLQETWRVTLGGAEHSGVTVRIASQDTNRLLVSPDGTTAGTAFIDLDIPTGSTTADFYVQGLNGVTGDVVLLATCPQFNSAQVTAQVTQSVIHLYSLPYSIAEDATDYEFRIRAGYLHTNGSTMIQAKVSAADNQPLQVLLRSNDTGIGQLRTAAEYGAEVTVGIPVNESYSPSSVLTGGVAFNPINAGQVQVTSYVNGFANAYVNSSRTVTVTLSED